MLEDVFEDTVEVGEEPIWFTLRHQEESSFILSELRENSLGKFVVVTYPDKENLVIRLGDDCELEYDEYYDDMGDANHNVYEGTLTLEEY